MGAYQYAAANWPWMEAMMVFNLNFNQPGLYQECEQMRYYAIQGRPAEAALRDMPKATIPTYAAAQVWPGNLTAVITPSQQPYTTTWPISLRNIGTQSFTYTAQTDETAVIQPVLSSANGLIAPGEQITVLATITSVERPSGVYTGTITLSATGETIGLPVMLPVRLVVADEIRYTYLPAVSR